MACDKPCDGTPDCCDKQKKCIEDHCKDVDHCLSEDELQELKDGFDDKDGFDSSVDAPGNYRDHLERKKPFSDRTFLTRFLSILYSSDEKNSERAECARLKKCILVPYDKTGESCCEGMTGHHIVPSSALKGKKGFEKYDENKALTVCLSGESNHKGTHGYIHMSLREGVRKLRKALGKREDAVCEAPYNEYLSTAVESFKDTTNNVCNNECIKNEIDTNLKGQCSDDNPGKVDAVWGNAAASDDNMKNCRSSHTILSNGCPPVQ